MRSFWDWMNSPFRALKGELGWKPTVYAKNQEFWELKCWLLLNQFYSGWYEEEKKNAYHGISVLLQASQYNNIKFQVHSQDFFMSLVLEVFAELKKILVIKWCHHFIKQSTALPVSLSHYYILAAFSSELKCSPFSLQNSLGCGSYFWQWTQQSEGKFSRVRWEVLTIYSISCLQCWDASSEKSRRRGIEGCSHALRLVPVS